MPYLLLAGLLVWAFGFPLPAAAGLPSSVGLSLSGNDDGRRDAWLDADLALRENARLSLGLGRSEGDDAAYDTRSWLVGLSSDPLADVAHGLEYVYWGNEDTLTSRTIRLLLDINLADGFLGLRPEYRELGLVTSDTCRRVSRLCPDKVHVKSPGVTLDGGYYWGDWGLTAVYAWHDYDRDVSVLAEERLLADEALRRYVTFYFATPTLDMATSFEDHRFGLGAQYFVGEMLLSVDASRSVSGVDGAITRSLFAALSGDLGRHWAFSLSAGRLASDAVDVVTLYAGAGLRWRW